MRSVIFFLLLCGLTIPAVASPPQQGNLGDDTYTITCDTGEEIIGGTIFTFYNLNPGFEYSVSALGLDGFDPVIAVVTAPGVGTCNDDFAGHTSGSIASQVVLPDIGLVEATERASQVTVLIPQSGNVDVVVGGYEGTSGQFAMVVEGLAISPSDELDGFLISVPEVVQDQAIGVFMVSRDGGTLDPRIEMYAGTGLQTETLDFNNISVIFSCDDVATNTGGDDCTNTPAFPGGGVMIANGYRYEAGTSDAGIIVTPGSTEKYLFAFGSYDGASSGDYAIIVLGNAPGNLDSTQTTTTTTTTTTGNNDTCNNVAMSVSSTSELNTTDFAAANLLDDDPTTGWSSTENSDPPLIAVALDGMHTVDSVWIDPYSYTPDFENDSVKDFDIVALDTAGNPVILLEATAPLEPGYRVYTFEPHQTKAIGISILTNYGGSYFSAADIMVCATD
jgi:hypothetical protein